MSTGALLVIVLAMLMFYSVVLLWLGLPVPTVAWLVAAVAGVSLGIACVGSGRSRSWLPQVARRALRAAAAERDATGSE